MIERFVRNEEVVGLIPIRSTNSREERSRADAAQSFDRVEVPSLATSQMSRARREMRSGSSIRRNVERSG